MRLKFHRRHIMTWSITIIGLLCTLYWIFSEEIPQETVITGESFPNILKVNPSKDKSIFFHETFHNGNNTITAHQACAVESAAIANPNFEVYLMFTSPVLMKDEGSESDRILKTLPTYNNIKLCHLDFKNYTNGTPLANYFTRAEIESPSFPINHASDVLRILTLWRYGGICLNFDVIVIKSLEKLPLNYAGAENDKLVGNGVLSFSSGGIGHNFAQQCAEDLKKDFRGNHSVYNGPDVITRLLEKICNAKTAREMVKSNCQGFKVYPQEGFHAVSRTKWRSFFNIAYKKETTKLSENSYTVHVWNAVSEDRKTNITSDNVAYSRFAKKFCPKIFAQCHEFF